MKLEDDVEIDSYLRLNEFRGTLFLIVWLCVNKAFTLKHLQELTVGACSFI